MTQTSFANLQPSRSLPILPRISSSDSLFLLPHPPFCLIRMLFHPCLFRYSIAQPETLKPRNHEKEEINEEPEEQNPTTKMICCFEKNPILDDVVSSQNKQHIFFLPNCHLANENGILLLSHNLWVYFSSY